MSVNEKQYADIFYDVVSVDKDGSGSVWLNLKGKLFNKTDKIPLLFVDKHFILVPESTVNVLFGGKNGNEKEQRAKDGSEPLRGQG